MRAASAWSRAADPVAAVGEVCERLRGELHGNPDLALAFVTSDLLERPDHLGASLQVGLQGAKVVGCGAAGVICGAEEAESGPALVVLAVALDGDEGGAFVTQSARRPGADVAADIANQLPPGTRTERTLALLCADPQSVDAAALPAALSRALGGAMVAGGGVSGGRPPVEIFGGTPHTGACAGIAVSLAVAPIAVVAHGCRPLGPAARVTKANGAVVMELDGKPALEVLMELLRAPENAHLRDAQPFVAVGLGRSPEAVERGEYAVRAIVGVQGPARAVAIAEAPAEGAGLAFLSREAVGARDAMREALSRARASGALDRPPAFGVYFDCASRGSALYGAEGLDATLIRRELGAFPLAGFFTSFEIGPVGGAPGVHLFTGVLALAPSAKA